MASAGGVDGKDVQRDSVKGEEDGGWGWRNTEEVLQFMDSGRGDRQNKDDYRRMHREVMQRRGKTKEAWLNSKCRELQEQREDPRSMHKRVQELFGYRKHVTTDCFKAEDGRILMDREGLLKDGQSM